MLLYTLAARPLLPSTNKGCKQVWYADDASAGGPLKPLRQWWNKLTDCGSIFGYFPNATKSWPIARLGFLDGFLDTAKHLYDNTNINITTEGRKYLGAALGNKKIGKTIPQTKVIEWNSEIETLAKITQYQQQVTLSTLTPGVIRRWICAMSTNEYTTEPLLPLGMEIQNKLISAITGRHQPGEVERIKAFGTTTPT